MKGIPQRRTRRIARLALVWALVGSASASGGAGDVMQLTGELRQWHKVTLTVRGPSAGETDANPNPFTDFRFQVRFTHESGVPDYDVPGYFAADGQAAETGATSGDRWRAHVAPDRPGRWHYRIQFTRGPGVAMELGEVGEPVAPWHGMAGSFEVRRTDKGGRDFRGRGRLQYVGRHHLRFAGSGEYFLKAGPDAPETLLAYSDFDGTEPGRSREARGGEAQPVRALHRYEPHVRDWHAGDPVWRGGKGKGLIGALNYLAAKGLNSVSFLPYNDGGDGDNVWPFVARGEKLHYDCSKLDQWGVVFDHATAQGLFLHFKLQETEIDDERLGGARQARRVPESLDGGRLGPERKLYCRELVARFGHALALNWNLGEENTQSTDEVRQMAAYLRTIDPYDHPIVLHTYPDEQDRVYGPLLGVGSVLTGVSLQNPWNTVHERTLHWVRESARAGRPWVVANDEQNDASLGVPPDPGYRGFDGVARERGGRTYTLHEIRKHTLWGNLMAGGAGVEYYFGYTLPENDLGCEDWRSRDRSWDYCRRALEFFREQRLPFWEMTSADDRVRVGGGAGSAHCLAKPGEVYLVQLPDGGRGSLDLRGAAGRFRVRWFNPREGGRLLNGAVRGVSGGGIVDLGKPPTDVGEDWLVVVTGRQR